MRIGQHEQAVADFTSALALNPHHRLAYINYNNRGFALKAQKNFDAAVFRTMLN